MIWEVTVLLSLVLGIGAVPLEDPEDWPRDQTRVSCIGMRILYLWATWEALYIINNAKQNCFVYYSNSFQLWSPWFLSIVSCASLTYFLNVEFFWGLSSFLEFQDDLAEHTSCPPHNLGAVRAPSPNWSLDCQGIPQVKLLWIWTQITLKIIES